MPQPYFKANALQVLYGNVPIWFNGSGNDSVYYLPYDDTYRLCIQWGSRAAVTGASTTVTYAVSYASGKTPTTFIQQIYNNPNYAPAITSFGQSSFIVDPAPGSNPKPQFNWISIGLVV
jgi:hypothetical protein